ncbi:hypothetical protein [Streptomyces sp. NPDC090022]|uniref:hypothetical protein n=1 Tax=Streptomyces sp. NPDC090022 TaxID=3365920 RepID=UPI00381F2275
MRLRITAAAFVGALALVLPTGAQALADDGKAFNYRFVDESGKEHAAQISDLADGKCLPLHEASADQSLEVSNQTDSVALLFAGKDCSGEPVVAAGPNEENGDFKAGSVRFEQVAQQEPGKAQETVTPGKADQSDMADEDADDVSDDLAEDEEDDDVFRTIFRTIG